MGGMSRIFSLCLMGTALTSVASAGMPFDFRTPDNFNTIKVRVVTSFGDGELKGEMRGARGKVEFDPEMPEGARGTLFFDARGIRLFYPKSQVDAHTSTWLNTKRFPQITFALRGIRNVRRGGKDITGEIVGTLTLKGKAKEIILPAKFRYLRTQRRRLDGRAGDLLSVQAELSILRGDFGINPGGMLDQVANEISVTVNLLGRSDKVRPLLPSKLFGAP